MMLQLVTDAVISKGYGGAPAFHSSEDGRMLSFKIGCKVYDKRADKETRWVNFNVNAFDDLAERVRRMNLKEGSHINVMGNFDMKPWVNRETGSGLSEGTNLLNGQQALAYARIRKLDADGDFSRTNRQRKVITALLESFLRPVPSGAGSPPDHHGHDRQGDPRLRRQPLSSDDRRRGRQPAHPRRRNLCQPQY